MSAPEPVLRGLVTRARPNETWGLITPANARLDDRSAAVFFHSSSVHGPRLGEGQSVLYHVAIDESGRARAVDVRAA